jgi:cell division protein FtsI/penicillin-binding protein 2/cell division protein FtsW (lipid II flippase)
MGITRSTAANRTTSGGFPGRALEFWLLLPVSVVIIAGICLVLMLQSHQMEDAVPGTDQGKLLNVNEISSSIQLQSLLNFYESPREQTFAALRVMAFLQDRGRIDSVVELREIRITPLEIERTKGLNSFAERLSKLREADPGAANSLPLFTYAQIRQLRAQICVRSKDSYYQLLFVYAAVFFLGFFALHAAWRVRGFSGDRVLLPTVHFLCGLGFVMMIRLRDPLRDALLFRDFAIGVGIGCIVALLVSRPDYERLPLRRLAYVPLLVSFILSLMLILFGSGPGLSDAKVNLRIGPMLFQPVELIKLLLLFFLAGFFADRWEFLRQLRQAPGTLPGILRGLRIPMLRYAAPMLIAVCLAIAFFFLEKDLGPALVMTILFIILYATARSKFSGALVACASLIAAVGIGYAYNVPRTVSARLTMWLSPWDNFVRPGGDHLAQSLWSFSTGGLFGTGLGLGEPASVPAAHTDLILAAIAEELGFIGFLCVALAYAVLVYRALRISLMSRGTYSLFLGLAAALLIGLQTIFIAAGILGLVPLSGVVTPFLNYGKSSMIANFALLGILASLSGGIGAREPSQPFYRQVSWTTGFLAAAGVLILLQAARVQIFQADRFLGRGALIAQADGHRRHTYNPRILEAARSIPRGTIYDRNGIPLATDFADLLKSFRAQYAPLRIEVDEVLKQGAGRLYPFEALTFHLLGDLRSRLNWGAPNSSYLERDWNAVLQGYDDRATVVYVSDHPGGPEQATIRRDFRELVPLVRYRYRPDKKEVREILNRDRDIHLSIDIRLQARVAAILEKYIRAAKTGGGAAVVINPATGELLSSVTYPWADVWKARKQVAGSDEIPNDSELNKNLLDRARFGLYPPGSSFKIVTAIAALQSNSDIETARFDCKRLPDGRIGNYVKGWGKPIRDDVLDKEPHGSVDMSKGLAVSCNAYFAQLGTYLVGAQRLLSAADLFGIDVASPNSASQLQDALPQASYGQGQVVASPLQMARVAGAIGNQGQILPGRIVLGDLDVKSKSCLTEEQAARLAGYLRRVVTEGTGREASRASVPVAGKTGTAELSNQPAHAWFVGFAPYGAGSRKKIAFAILIENGRYGGRAAAPAAAEIADAAGELGLIGRE